MSKFINIVCTKFQQVKQAVAKAHAWVAGGFISLTYAGNEALAQTGITITADDSVDTDGSIDALTGQAYEILLKVGAFVVLAGLLWMAIRKVRGGGA